MITVGILWNQIFPVSSYWTPEQAKEYQDAFYAAHAAQDAVENGKLVADATELAAVRDRFLQIQAELKNAQSARGKNGNYVLILGLIVLMSTFVLRYFWTSPEEDKVR